MSLQTTRSYNEAYYTTRKKILEDFIQEEDKETLEYIESVESIVSLTKLTLKSLVNGDIDYESFNDNLSLIEKMLQSDCDTLINDINIIKESDKSTEQETVDMQKQEEKSILLYLDKIEILKKEMEIKEFKIQNMERLYVELEDIIKENIKNGNEQLLTLDQINEFLLQNEKLKEEIDFLEKNKNNCNFDYNNLLRDNVNLKSQDESFELEKVKDVLQELSSMGQMHAKAQIKINSLQKKFNDLTKECSSLANQICSITKNLESLNIDNQKLNNELAAINQQLNPFRNSTNKSYCETYTPEINTLFENNVEVKLQPKMSRQKTSLI